MVRFSNFSWLNIKLPSSVAGEKTCAASWFLSAPSGRNAFQSQSVRSCDTKGAPSRRFSDSVRSSPPKNGWIGISPASLILFQLAASVQYLIIVCFNDLKKDNYFYVSEWIISLSTIKLNLLKRYTILMEFLC